MKIIKVGFSLLPFLVVCIVVVFYVNHLTKDDIIKQEKLSLIKKLKHVFPSKGEKTIVKEVIKASSPIIEQDNKSYAWLVCEKSQLSGWILPIKTTKGYSGDITVLIGLSTDYVIKGLSVLSHQETPGLGDKMDQGDTPWLNQFIAHTQGSSWEIRKYGADKNQGFDAITAATITSKAVIQLLEQTLKSVPKKNLPQNC